MRNVGNHLHLPVGDRCLLLFLERRSISAPSHLQLMEASKRSRIALDWRPVQGAPCVSPKVGCDRFQLSTTLWRTNSIVVGPCLVRSALVLFTRGTIILIDCAIGAFHEMSFLHDLEFMNQTDCSMRNFKSADRREIPLRAIHLFAAPCVKCRTPP